MAATNGAVFHARVAYLLPKDYESSDELANASADP